MSKPLNELKVLKKLNIVDFRHLTKDKVIKMASILDKMDPEVAKKALEQFPEFSATAKEMLNNYKDTLDKGLEANKESIQTYYDTCNSLIDILKKQLEADTLSFEERKYIIDKMMEISKMIGEKDSENKRFIATMAVIGGTVVGVVAVALVATLGGNTQIEGNDDDTDYLD
jgi:ribosomal protein S17E